MKLETMKLSGRILELELVGDDVRRLQAELGRIGLDISREEVDAARFGQSTEGAVRQFQEQQGVEATGIVDDETALRISHAVHATGDGGRDAAAGDSYCVTGLVASPELGGIAGLGVLITDRNVGADVTLAETTTDEHGYYTATFSVGSVCGRTKDRPDLQVRVLAGGETLATSEVRYDASPQERLDVVLPEGSAGLPSEFDALASAMAAHVDGHLGDLREDDEHQDLTYLAGKSGWDARAVAFLSLSHTFSRQAGENGHDVLQPEHYYALFRAGVAADSRALYGLSPRSARAVWEQAIARRVVPASVGETLDEAVEGFQRLSAEHALGATSGPGASTLRELLRPSLGDDVDRGHFAAMLVAHRDDPAKMWDEVREAFGPVVADRLRLDGQLALLTLDNAPLISRLHDAAGENPLTSPADLARCGYHRPEKWHQPIEGLVPPQIPGDDEQTRAGNYAELLAAQVRLSFPTAVVADQVGRGTVKLSDDPAIQAAVHRFLADHAGAFEIGMQPIDHFIASADVDIQAPVRDHIRRLQRVYQITPDDQAMSVLLEHGLDSAHSIVHHGTDALVARLGEQLGGEKVARAVAAKAQQVHLAVLNVATSYLTTRAAPALGADPDALLVDPGRQFDALRADGQQPAASPTLEALFESMDYCACEHCRSVLSPAAYLVDLLLFADHSHNEKENPQAVLFERRPDLQHLPLTCENTNTPLPYIDIVNETLEHLVANGLSLSGYTGHDTGEEARAEDLLAGPQFVQDQAYKTLKDECFPPPLPFHRPLEVLRRYFTALAVPLETAMEALRADEAVERAQPGDYAWRDVLIERLKLSRAEHRLLTDRTVSLADLYGFPSGTTEAQALESLADVKAFTRRVGVDYDDLVALLETAFVNPDADLIPRMRGLGVSFETLAKVKDRSLSDLDLARQLPTGVTVAQVKAFVKDHYDRASQLILMKQEDLRAAPGSLDGFRLRYAHPDPAKNALRPIDYVRLARFIRLWRKLGWTIEQTDSAITALYPTGAPSAGIGGAADLAALDAGFLKLLPRLGVVQATMERLKVVPGPDFAGLLACWAPIGVHGRDALYGHLFLGAAFLARDPAFAPDDNGAVLQDNAQRVEQHAEALRAATGLTADELSLVLGTLTGGLTRENVSAVYRHSWFARRLEISVAELLALIRHTGLDPFAAPDPPSPPMIALLDLLDALRGAGLTPSQALYLMFDDDLAGTSAPEAEQIAAFARTLRTGFADIDAQFAIVDDPSGDLARARMALIYGAEAADFLFALLDGTFTVSVPYTHPTDKLDESILTVGGDRLSYDPLRKQLSYAGVLPTAPQPRLQDAPNTSTDFKTAVARLDEEMQKKTASFFARYPELLELYSDSANGLVEPDAKRRVILDAFLPQLVHQRKRQQAFATLSAVLRVAPALAETITADPAVLHADGDTTRPALDDLTAIEAQGLSAQLFWGATIVGTPHPEPTPQPTVDYGPQAPATPLPTGSTAGAPISGVWSGFLEAPETAEFTFAVDTDAKSVTLTLNGTPIDLNRDGTSWLTPKPIALTAGRLSALRLTVEKVTKRLTLRWQSTGRGWEIVPGRRLYPATAMDRLRATYVRILKAGSLATATKLTASEFAHLAVAHQVGDEGWLNALRASDPNGPRASDPADRGTDLELTAALRALLAFAALKAELSPDDERFLTVLKHPAATNADGTSLLLQLTGWQSTSLALLLTRFGNKRDDLAHVETFARVYHAYAALTKLGMSAEKAIAATTNDPTPEVAAAFQTAVRARYGEADWQAVLRPINDELRSLQRDALVAYVLRRLSEKETTAGVDTPDKLFEHLLMDVGMQPCQLTSRIRHALSSVQLFLERCLMNLEPRVAPSSIDAAQWEWMKRYRVWEANRKVFLWPENWLEPELRDDQSPIFKETMSELLQGDITEDRAGSALMSYLMKLEEVAQLELCGICVDEQDPGTADNEVVHVVARTSGARRKYFYRRREHGSWTPWEPIKLDIEDNPVTPVVWKGRLFLFWLRIIKETPMDPTLTSSSVSGAATGLTLGQIKADAVANAATTSTVHVKFVLSYSEYLDGKWQPVKTSDPDRPTSFGIWAPGLFDRSSLYPMGATLETTGDLTVGFESTFGTLGFGGIDVLFRLSNTHSAPVREEDMKFRYDVAADKQRDLGFGIATTAAKPDDLTAKYLKGLSLDPGGAHSHPAFMIQHTILTASYPMTVVQRGQGNLINDPWSAPFLASDARHSFYVEVTPHTISLQRFAGFGLSSGTGKPATDMPPIRWNKGPHLNGKPDAQSALLNGPVTRVTAPGAIGQIVSEDTFITKTLGNVGTVRFGSNVIGPAGALFRESLANRGEAAP
ncbi:neuraminidase-like domain-containing protein [Streptomyces lydicus]|uniref:neuraminidase-like domain-containing protein n=1 Tax=Streptomyces lydicus TaxID=47763 RepID=UPI0037FCA3C1